MAQIGKALFRINLDVGGGSRQLAIHQGEEPEVVAADFVEAHGLPQNLAPILAAKLRQGANRAIEVLKAKSRGHSSQSLPRTASKPSQSSDGSGSEARAPPPLYSPSAFGIDNDDEDEEEEEERVLEPSSRSSQQGSLRDSDRGSSYSEVKGFRPLPSQPPQPPSQPSAAAPAPQVPPPPVPAAAAPTSPIRSPPAMTKRRSGRKTKPQGKGKGKGKGKGGKRSSGGGDASPMAQPSYAGETRTHTLLPEDHAFREDEKIQRKAAKADGKAKPRRSNEVFNRLYEAGIRHSLARQQMHDEGAKEPAAAAVIAGAPQSKEAEAKGGVRPSSSSIRQTTLRLYREGVEKIKRQRKQEQAAKEAEPKEKDDWTCPVCGHSNSGELWFCAGEVRYPGWEDTYEYTTYAEAARRAHASGSATATKLRMPTHTSGPEPDTCGAPRPAPFTPVISRAAKALQRGRDALAVELYRHVHLEEELKSRKEQQEEKELSKYPFRPTINRRSDTLARAKDAEAAASQFGVDLDRDSEDSEEGGGSGPRYSEKLLRAALKPAIAAGQRVHSRGYSGESAPGDDSHFRFGEEFSDGLPSKLIVDRHLTLYEDAYGRRERAAEREMRASSEYPFRPSLGPAARRLSERKDPERGAMSVHERLYRRRFEKDATMKRTREAAAHVDLTTGQPMFRPSVGRGPQFGRNLAARPIGEYLFAARNESKELRELLAKEEEAYLKQLSNTRYTNNKSEALLLKMRNRLFIRLFNYLKRTVSIPADLKKLYEETHAQPPRGSGGSTVSSSRRRFSGQRRSVSPHADAHSVHSKEAEVAAHTAGDSDGDTLSPPPSDIVLHSGDALSLHDLEMQVGEEDKGNEGVVPLAHIWTACLEADLAAAVQAVVARAKAIRARQQEGTQAEEEGRQGSAAQSPDTAMASAAGPGSEEETKGDSPGNHPESQRPQPSSKPFPPLDEDLNVEFPLFAKLLGQALERATGGPRVYLLAPKRPCMHPDYEPRNEEEEEYEEEQRQLNAKAKKRPTKGKSEEGALIAREENVEDRLLEAGRAYALHKEALERERQDEEQEVCTFRPDTSKSMKSVVSSVGKDGNFHYKSATLSALRQSSYDNPLALLDKNALFGSGGGVGGSPPDAADHDDGVEPRPRANSVLSIRGGTRVEGLGQSLWDRESLTSRRSSTEGLRRVSTPEGLQRNLDGLDWAATREVSPVSFSSSGISYGPRHARASTPSLEDRMFEMVSKSVAVAGRKP